MRSWDALPDAFPEAHCYLRKHLERWARDGAGARAAGSLDALWKIEEECIAALAQ